MKYIGFFLVLFYQTHNAIAQLNLPEPSPPCEIKQKVGFAHVSIAYSRPSAKGRKIFGSLVPFNELWRTGASDATLLRLSDDVLIEGKKIIRGTYSLYSIPAEKEWTIILNKDTTLHGTSGYKDSLDVMRFKVSPFKSSKYYETFTIEIGPIIKGMAVISLLWENTEVNFKLDSEADRKVMDDINTRVIQKKESDPALLYQSALYYYDNDKDLPLALSWLKEIEKKDPDAKYLILESKILKKQGKIDEAIARAKAALEYANKTGSKNYIKMSSDLVQELTKK